MQVPLLMNADSATSKAFLAGLEDRKLAVVIHETWAHRDLMGRVKQEVWRPSEAAPAATSSTSAASPLTPTPTPTPTPPTPTPTKGEKRNHRKRNREPDSKHGECQLCMYEKPEDKCVHEMEVFARKDAKRMIGAALTCAPPGDRLKPRPPSQPKDGEKPVAFHMRYVNPEEKGFIWLKPRPETMHRCSKDIVRCYVLHPDGSKEWVGGVRFNPMSTKTLDELLANHRRVIICALRRRGVLQRWAHGSMTGTGWHEPTGGRKGDGYSLYACHTGDTADDMKALHRHAVDVDVVVEIGSSIIPNMKANMKAATKAVDAGRLGLYGLANFYCTDYISCIHPDFDISRADIDLLLKLLKSKSKLVMKAKGECHPCVQLAQSGTDKKNHEWDFAMYKWGVVIETHPNTVWCFNGRHEHGSVMPSQTSVNNNAASSGFHPTKKDKTAARAAKIRQIRIGLGERDI
ncbi:hypothetical protein C8R43DRAFT_945465 [Mycena crocata]|nr:hypothetical protein C8R43DRAFT_945465 [Mycena crocata]